MKRFLKIVTVLVFVAVVVGGAAYALKGGVPVETAIVEIGVVRTYVEEMAKTRLPEIYRLTMPLDGRIRRITLQAGDTVSAGDVVAQMDPADLDTDLSEATAQFAQFGQLLLSMRDTIQAAEAQRSARNEQLKFFDSEYKRIRSLAETNVVSESDRNRAEMQKLQSSFEFQEETFTVQAIRAVRMAVEIGRDDAAEKRHRRQRDRNRTKLLSPIDGVILQRHVSNERVLQAGEPLLEIGRLEGLEVEAEILTQDVVTIEIDDAVDIVGLAIGPEPVRGTVTRIQPQGFTKVSSLGVEQQRVLVIIRFDLGELETLHKRGHMLQADYRVRVKIYTGQRSGTLKIPRFALFRGTNGNWQTFAVRNGKARRVNVEVGLMNDFEVEALSGLQAGERVIIAPQSNLKDGQSVEPL